MLTDDDIQKLIAAFKDTLLTKSDAKNFATKEDLIKMEERINEKILDSKEEVIEYTDARIDSLIQEFLDYSESHFDTHKDELKTHDERIQMLEQFHA